MSSRRSKTGAVRKFPGHLGPTAPKEPLLVHPATASQIRRTLKVSKRQLAVARELLASVRSSRRKSG